MLEQRKESWTMENELKIAKTPSGWECVKGMSTDICPTHMIQELPPTEKNSIGEISQRMILERHEIHYIQDFYFSEIWEKMYDVACQGRNDEINFKGLPVMQRNEFTGKRNQYCERPAENKSVENWLELSCPSHLAEMQKLHTKSKIYECSQFEKLAKLVLHFHYFQQFLPESTLTLQRYMRIILCSPYHSHKTGKCSEKNLTNIMSVARPLLRAPTSPDI